MMTTIVIHTAQRLEGHNQPTNDLICASPPRNALKTCQAGGNSYVLYSTAQYRKETFEKAVLYVAKTFWPTGPLLT